jgi:hypothetical protein
MARQWHGIPNRESLARLRGLAGEHGYAVERGPVRDTWILTSEKTGVMPEDYERWLDPAISVDNLRAMLSLPMRYRHSSHAVAGHFRISASW